MKAAFPEEVYLNGQWFAPQEAKISVFDRGFLYGDGIYEVIPFYKGKAFLLEEHLNRLKYCLEQIHLDIELDDFPELAYEALKRSGLSKEDSAVYIQVTRGSHPRTHFIPKNTVPSIFMYAFPARLKDFENRSWKVLLSKDLRWNRCDIKTTSWLANTMANTESHEQGLDETILFKDEVITEGSHSSIFFIKNGEVFTHPEGPEILSGITRSFVIDLLAELNIPVTKRPFKLEEITEADEVFCTGTTTQVMQVVEIWKDKRRIFNTSTMSNILKKLQKAFIEKTRNL